MYNDIIDVVLRVSMILTPAALFTYFALLAYTKYKDDKSTERFIASAKSFDSIINMLSKDKELDEAAKQTCVTFMQKWYKAEYDATHIF